MSTYVEVHILQSLPSNVLNRDGENRPKTAWYGNTPRMRVSSQAWKKAVRREFTTMLDPDKLGLRSREFAGMIADRLHLDPDNENVIKAAITVMGALGLPDDKERPGCTKAVQFFGEPEWRLIARVVGQALDSSDPEQAIKAHTKALRKSIDMDHAVDIALFGRMSASDEKNDTSKYVVDAACQFAHAIGVNRTEVESDYFTTVDEAPNAPASAMIGETGYVNGTVYRYANINVQALERNLAHDQDAVRATIDAFIRADAISLPTGKTNSFAPMTLPAFILTTIRDDRPVNLVDAFEAPVKGTDVTRTASRLLTERCAALDEAFSMTPSGVYALTTMGADPELDAALQRINAQTCDSLDQLAARTVATTLGK
ncbi:type I-E CRISPR-associated protein Cas7/Cse4/CasC [Bifidobacterium rousetti]|uniref:type I-E CRISPR-associated protein Cas7/Cse4/CasC n=1 Tax=Bifidobacterium rousetti TaxID=2045439 RepID=UPI00123A14EC|nr:type I-E CRISPR-associated protein Cas7/Cse4/CasC [Bifidobacterium rousetti]KAA8816132.1 type I-E CRISPR-associated protein Cas7/Cse4/CasC [Bifidobacterium rousetti]